MGIKPGAAHNVTWERRQRGGLYYTRTRRLPGGRRVREYVGGGQAGELAAALDAQRRAERLARAEASRREQARLEAAGLPLAGLCEVNHLLVRAALLAAGFHRHRGEWRGPIHEPDHDRQSTG